MTAFRTALVAGSGITAERVAAYLPSNYEVLESDITGRPGDTVIIGGHDVAGWTLDGYVLPRLASGLMFGTEEVLDSDPTPPHGMVRPDPLPGPWADEADYLDSRADDEQWGRP